MTKRVKYPAGDVRLPFIASLIYIAFMLSVRGGLISELPGILGDLVFLAVLIGHSLAASRRYGWPVVFRTRLASSLVLGISLLLLPLALLSQQESLFTWLDPPAVLRGSLLVLAALELGQVNQLLRRRIPVGVFISLGFAVLILVGSLLLMMPATIRTGNDLTFIDALFTATSAACVTGLTVVDTGTFFTPLGHGVLLFLFQIGGLGILTVTSFFAMLLARDLGTSERLAIRENLRTGGLIGLRSLILRIIGFTLVVELVGAACLYFSQVGVLGVGGGRIFASLFHSVSAFCNAGFSLQGDSLAGFVDHPGAIIAICLLIMLGGLGFLLCFELMGRRRKQRRRLSLQARLVIVGSLVLWVGGTLFFLGTESGGALADYGPGTKLLGAFFQSVTTRTAGFELFPQAELSAPGHFASIMLMFIGAAPGSTGGGIKVSTLVLGILLLASYFRGRDRVDVAGRTIPETVMREALAVLSAAIFAVLVGTTLLLVLEGTTLERSLFEVVSAFATVGLSTGLSAEMGVAGKILLTVLMFLGRLGPVTVALAVSGGLHRRSYRLPEEAVMVG